MSSFNKYSSMSETNAIEATQISDADTPTDPDACAGISENLIPPVDKQTTSLHENVTTEQPTSPESTESGSPNADFQMSKAIPRNGVVINPDVAFEMLDRQKEEADLALIAIDVSLTAIQANRCRLERKISALEDEMFNDKQRLISERETLSRLSANLSALSEEQQTETLESNRLASLAECTQIFLTSLQKCELQLEFYGDQIRRGFDFHVEDHGILASAVQLKEEKVADLKQELVIWQQVEALRLRADKRLARSQELPRQATNQPEVSKKSVDVLEGKILELQQRLDAAVALRQATEEQWTQKNVESLHIMENLVKIDVCRKLINLDESRIKLEEEMPLQDVITTSDKLVTATTDKFVTVTPATNKPVLVVEKPTESAVVSDESGEPTSISRPQSTPAPPTSKPSQLATHSTPFPVNTAAVSLLLNPKAVPRCECVSADVNCPAKWIATTNAVTPYGSSVGQENKSSICKEVTLYI